MQKNANPMQRKKQTSINKSRKKAASQPENALRKGNTMQAKKTKTMQPQEIDEQIEILICIFSDASDSLHFCFFPEIKAKKCSNQCKNNGPKKGIRIFFGSL